MDLRLDDHALDAQTHVVEVEGQLDLYTAPAFRQRISRAIDAGATRLIVDMSGVRFIDSTALGVLVGARKRLMPEGGRIAIVVKDFTVERLFEATGLDATFPLFDSRQDALDGFEITDRLEHDGG